MIILSFISLLKEIDAKLLLFINGAHSDFADVLMFGVSNKYTWIPLYLLILWLVWKHYGKKGIWVVLSFALAVTLADQISVHLFKNVFQRYRPCHNLDLQGLLHLVNGKCGGKFGFVSSHAANTAAVATVGIFFFRKHAKWIVWVLLGYTLLNCYSRVYMGVHYPSDVVGGFFLGVAGGLIASIIVTFVGKMKKNIFATIVLVFIGLNAQPQQYGCTDPIALNFDSLATHNDGSCEYEASSVTPSESISLPSVMQETSGLMYFNNTFWTHNDDTDTHLYSFQTTNTDDYVEYLLQNVINIDWEEITQDSNYVYLGDVGNNSNGNRTDLKILRIEKQSLLNHTPVVDTISFFYSDQSDFSGSGSNNTDFDCEAFVVFGDSIFLFTKQWIGEKTKVYSFPKTPGTYEAVHIEEYDVQGLITGACFHEDKNIVVLCGYSPTLDPFIYILYDFQMNRFFSGNKRMISLQLPFHQVEAITSEDFYTFYVTNEYFSFGSITTHQKIHCLDLGPFFSDYLGTSNMREPELIPEKIRVFPNPATDILYVDMPKDAGGFAHFEIFDLQGRLLAKGRLHGNSIDVSSLTQGMYIVTLETGGQRHSVKLERE